MTLSRLAWTLRARLSANGASDLPSRGFPASRLSLGAGDPPSFPPSVVAQVEALACELPHRLQLPLSRLSLSEIRREVITQGLVAEISGATLWRWLLHRLREAATRTAFLCSFSIRCLLFLL